MKKADFEIEVDAYGFQLYYKHRHIGGRRAASAPTGRAAQKIRKSHEQEARREIQYLIEGRGIGPLQQRAAEIDEAFEKIRRGEYGKR